MTDQLKQLKSVLADRYEIERELGSGGLAIVYLARDLKLRRQVTLKVLRPVIASSLGVDRFLHEIETAATLRHPNIVSIHDCGRIAGRQGDGTEFLYYVMPYVEGESLRDRLNREKQLPIEDALQITKEVADALGYVHSMGLVHRDIKPENILFTAGHAVVSDFGVASALASASAEELEETGLFGMHAYVSPEQARGDTIDARSDLYSLGCVLYEMLSGDAPYTASTPQAVLAKKQSEPIPRISVVRETVPAVVEVALTKALAKNPADRFVTTQQFVDALASPSVGLEPSARAAKRKRPAWHWIAGLAAVGAVVAVGVLLFDGWRSGADTAAAEDIDRLVVAPLENRTGDSGAADWGFYAAEYVTRALDQAAVITVVPASVVRDLVRDVDPAAGMSLDEIARRTGARYAVAGSYSTSAGRLRFDVELVDAASRDLLRALDPAGGSQDSLQAVFSILAGRVTAATMALLNPDLGPEFAKWSSPPSIEVFRGLMATQDIFCRTRYQDAIDQAQPALEEAPDFAPLLLLVSISLGNLGRLREADSVLALIEPLTEQLTTDERLLADWYHGRLHGDHAEATFAVEELFRIQPSAYGFHAGLQALRVNRFADALERLLAQDLDTPCYRRWSPWWRVTAQAYHMLGRYQEELDVAREGLEQFPNVRRLSYFEAIALAGLGRLNAVDSLLDLVTDLPPQPRGGGGEPIHSRQPNGAHCPRVEGSWQSGGLRGPDGPGVGLVRGAAGKRIAL